MRETGISLKRSLLEKLDRPCCTNGVRDDLIVLSVHHQNRHINGLQILVKLSFGERLDAVVLCLDPTHHSLAPPVISDALRNLCARTVVTIKRKGEVLVELGPM